MSKHLHVYLNDEQRAHLQNLIRSGTQMARVLGKARILLLADRSAGERRTRVEIAQAALVSLATVGRVCRQFAAQGMEAALYDRPRPGAVPKITGAVEAQLITLACSDPPTGRGRWTLQLLADELISLGLVDSISDVAVYQRLKKTNLNLGR